MPLTPDGLRIIELAGQENDMTARNKKTMKYYF